METQDIIQAVIALIDSLGTIGVLVFAWLQAQKRADRLEDDIIEDWKFMRARDANPAARRVQIEDE